MHEYEFLLKERKFTQLCLQNLYPCMSIDIALLTWELMHSYNEFVRYSF